MPILVTAIMEDGTNIRFRVGRGGMVCNIQRGVQAHRLCPHLGSDGVDGVASEVDIDHVLNTQHLLNGDKHFKKMNYPGCAGGSTEETGFTGVEFIGIFGVANQTRPASPNTYIGNLVGYNDSGNPYEPDQITVRATVAPALCDVEMYGEECADLWKEALETGEFWCCQLDKMKSWLHVRYRAKRALEIKERKAQRRRQAFERELDTE